MDSCNSGSLQSSSTGEEEFDSRNDSISAFFKSSSTSSFSHHAPPPITSHHHHHNPSSSSSSSFFDSISSYLDTFPRSPLPDTNPPNPNVAWTKSLRPSPPSQNPNFSETTLIGSSSLSNPSPPTASTPQAPRGAKKRSRASRRAPTTVMTTDTSNFRAMVQEFTGIPTPPFGASSLPFSRPRLDLLHAATVPPYLLRPFAQKAHAQAPLFNPIPSSSMPDPIPSAITSSNTNANTSTTTTTTTACGRTTNTSHLAHSSTQGQELLNIGGPIFSFPSLLQPPTIPKYNSLTLSAFDERPQAPTMVVATEYGLGNLEHAVSSEIMNMRERSSDPSVWPDASGSSDDRAQLRPVIASTSAARGGVVDTWIIPSEQ